MRATHQPEGNPIRLHYVAADRVTSALPGSRSRRAGYLLRARGARWVQGVSSTRLPTCPAREPWLASPPPPSPQRGQGHLPAGLCAGSRVPESREVRRVSVVSTMVRAVAAQLQLLSCEVCAPPGTPINRNPEGGAPTRLRAQPRSERVGPG